MRQKKIHQYTVKFEPNDEGGWLAIVPALPEVQTEGWTFAEAQEMAKDAISLCLRVRRKKGQPIPKDVDYKAVKAPKFLKLEVAA
jgi:antitoxin HicB